MSETERDVDEPPAGQPEPGRRRFPALQLIVRGLAIRRGQRRLFEGLELELSPGDVVQLVGPNGAGKSTLIRAIAGFIRPDAGTISWPGLDPEAEPASLIHYHGHREGLRDALNVRENLTFAAELSGGEVGRIDTALAELAIARLADLPVAVLSAGQRRRVALARLLVASRPLWLLDEPLAALDLEGQAIVARLIGRHAKAGGLALVATHQPLGLESRRLDLAGFAPARRAA